MRRFGSANARLRDTQITVRNLTSTELVDGFYVNDNATEVTLFARVMDKKEIGSVLESKRLTARSLVLEVDSRSAETVNENSVLTTDRDDAEYEVVDKYDDQWKFTSILICEYKR